MFSSRVGLQSVLKDGGRHFKGVDETTIRSIDACRRFGAITKTSLGPSCMNKLIVNHIDKRYVTSDTATIIEQLEVQNPAAKVVALAATMQQQDYHDGSNFVVLLATELLSNAETLIRQGVHISSIAEGYEAALEKSLSLLPELCCLKIADVRSNKEVLKALTAVFASKGLGFESILPPLVTEAVLHVMPSNPLNLNLDNIRVAKLEGGNLRQSSVISGMLITRKATGCVKEKSNCKVMILSCGLEVTSTETKGTVLLTNADELLNFSKGEEEEIEAIIQAVSNSGVEVICAGGNISDLAQHFCDKYGIMTIKCQSKFELRRLCRTLGAVALVRLGAPTPDEVGYADSVKEEEISSRKVVIIKARDSKVSTIIVRAATSNTMDEVERSIEDGVHCIKNIIEDQRFVPGAGACETELCQRLQAYGATVSGLAHYGILKFAEALEVFPRQLCENAGLNVNKVIADLHAAHKLGGINKGVDVLAEEENCILDVLTQEQPIVDHLTTKVSAIRLATDAALTVLRVDQIIMARPAGGPAPPKQNGAWDED